MRKIKLRNYPRHQMADKICSICLTNESKYTCPACETKTCSLECSKRHKKQSDCSGLVDQSRFIPKKDLSETSLHVNRDYNFLMKLGREIVVGKNEVHENAKNIFKRGNNSNYNRNKRVKLDASKDVRMQTIETCFPENVSTMIKRQNTLVIMLPDGMARSSSNKTGFDKKLQTFTWTIQWIFKDEAGETKKDFISYRINENLPLETAVPITVLQTIVPDIKVDSLNFYLENVIKRKHTRTTFIPLDSTKTIAENLKDTIVLEYPTVHICMKELTENLIPIAKAYTTNESESESESESDDDSDSSSESDSSASDSDSSEESSDEAPEETSSKINEPNNE